MKKLFTLFCLLAMVGSGFAQSTQFQPISHSVSPNKRVAPPVDVKTYPVHSSSRAASYPLLLDYDGNDAQYAANLGFTYTRYIWNLNNRYVNSDTFSLKYAAVFMDTLQYLDGNLNLAYYPKASTTLNLDSFGVYFQHVNTSGTNDTLHITVFNTSAATTVGLGSGSGAGVLVTPVVWDTFVYSNTSMLLNTQFYTRLVCQPNISFAQGQTFGVRVDFSGNTLDTLYVLAGERDECSAACAAKLSVACDMTKSKAGTDFYLNFWTGTGINFSGLQSSQVGNFFYNCDGSGVFHPELCENFYIQNLTVFAYTTASIQYGATVSADSLHGCTGSTTNLCANVFGTSNFPVTYHWAASSGNLSSNTDSCVMFTLGSTNATITCTVTDAAGDSIVVTKVDTSKAINISITNPNPLTVACGSSALITTTISGVTAGKIYRWSTGASGANMSTITVTTPGTYTVTVTNSSGCSSIASIVVQYPSISNTITFNPPNPICATQSDTFMNTSLYQNGWNFNWIFAAGDTSHLQNGVNVYPNAGIYTVVLKMDSGGCTFASAPVQVTVLSATNALCSSGIQDIAFENKISLVPNPNNGEVNIVVNGIEKNIAIKIYNIIGAEVKSYTSSDVNSVFNKNFNFSDLANGTYLVKIQSGDRTAMKKMTISK